MHGWAIRPDQEAVFFLCTFHAPVRVWAVKERRKPLSIRDSSDEGLLESQDQYDFYNTCLFTYLI